MTVVPVPPVRPVRVVRPAAPTPPIALRPAVQSGPGGAADVDTGSGSGNVTGSGRGNVTGSGTATPSPAEIEVIRIVGWPDPVIDKLGYDPRSLYVETFWLGILGPTCTWLMRRLAAGLDDDPAGFDLDLADTARALGLGGRSGRHSPFRRALARCVTFEVARREGPITLAARRRLPPLPRRHLLRLPETLQEQHVNWMVPNRSSAVLEDARRTARRLALGLLAAGEGRPEVELQLVRWRVHPALAHEATQWAWAFRAHEAKSVGAGRVGHPA
jgi:hypothetical protein